MVSAGGISRPRSATDQKAERPPPVSASRADRAAKFTGLSDRRLRRLQSPSRDLLVVRGQREPRWGCVGSGRDPLSRARLLGRLLCLSPLPGLNSGSGVQAALEAGEELVLIAAARTRTANVSPLSGQSLVIGLERAERQEDPRPCVLVMLAAKTVAFTSTGQRPLSGDKNAARGLLPRGPQDCHPGPLLDAGAVHQNQSH